MNNDEYRALEAKNITIVGFIINFILTLFKIIAGIIGKSSAMVADGIHSLSDFSTDIILIIGMEISKKPIDKDHDYGHGKFETLTTFLIGFILLLIGGGILINGIKNIYLSIKGVVIEKPGLIALIAAIISIVLKEFLYRITITIAKKIDSNALVANAWHHRSDSLSSIGTLIGISGAIFLGEKWRILDPIAASIVSFFIIAISIKIIKESLNELMDSSLDQKTEDHIINIINSFGEVSDPHNLKTRKIGNKIAIDVHIRVEDSMTVKKAHIITEKIEKELKKEYGESSFIYIHIEPKL